MQRYIKKRLLLHTLAIFVPILLFNPYARAGSFGAEIFCTMREGGNDHESSWDAAYTYIKKQKGGIFKVSPKQAAAQIVETVVREKENFIDCIQYLDKLNPDRKQQAELKKQKEKEAKEKEAKRIRLEKNQENYSEETFDRYSY
tara:strand:- start:12 stop:443 length:432 start_codon:yes stop_codon:yes gene_type:complete